MSLEDSIYCIIEKKNFPNRWTAPEAFALYDDDLITKEAEITTAADVWSFGVVMWELYTNGHVSFYVSEKKVVISLQEPYKEYDDRDLYKRLTIGKKRLECPEKCSLSVIFIFQNVAIRNLNAGSI